jgi:hypothetical protein
MAPSTIAVLSVLQDLLNVEAAFARELVWLASDWIEAGVSCWFAMTPVAVSTSGIEPTVRD